MQDVNRNGIIEILLNQGIIDQEKYSKAKELSISTGKSIEDILVLNGWMSELDVVKAKSIMFGIPFVDIANTSISLEMADLLSEDESLKLKVLIYEKDGNFYKAAMSNPLDIQTIRYLEQKLNSQIQIYIALEKDLYEKTKNSYSGKFSSEVSSVVEEAVSSSDFVDISADNDTATSLESIDITNAPVAKIVNLILESAVQEKASDIHIEPQKDRIRVRFRIHGILQEKLSLPLQVGPSLVSRIKILAKMQIDEKRKPLDGGFQIKSRENQEIDLRISSLPTVMGEKVVIRLLRKDLGIMRLEDTGMRGTALRVFAEGLKGTSGIILVTGPTGSGKTVTVSTCLNLLNKGEVNIVSIEDPVEIKIAGINQVQVNVDAGLTFATALRAFLRQDPNIIDVGEIRDEETAQLAAQASLTGHLVISTLHTNSAAGVLPRLLDMGIEPYIIASTVQICSAQRLCRKICNNCKVAYEITDTELLELKKVIGSVTNFNPQKFGEYQQKFIFAKSPVEKENIDGIEAIIDAESPIQPQQSTALTPSFTNNNSPTNENTQKLYLFKGKGCDKCGNTGYSGRVGIFEVFRVTEKIGNLVMQQATSEEIERVAMEDGMLRMIQDGYLKCLDGITTLEEVQRVIHL